MQPNQQHQNASNLSALRRNLVKPGKTNQQGTPVGDDGMPTLAVRVSDGLIVPYPPIVRGDSNLRPWWGSANPTDEEIEQFLFGHSNHVTSRQIQRDMGGIDLATATKEEMIEYAQDEFGVSLPTNKDVDSLRGRILAMMANPPKGTAAPAPKAAIGGGE